MIELSEIKKYVELHIKSQQFQDLDPQKILNSISTLQNNEGSNEGSWGLIWTRAAEQSLKKGYVLDAIQCYNFARFPYPETNLQKKAGQELNLTFENHFCNEDIRKHTVNTQDGRFSFYTANLNFRKPCLIVLGGIVSIKEQWSIFLITAKKMGLSVVLTEFPGVGENHLIFNEYSHQMIGTILDYLTGYTDVENTFIVGMSFGGQLAIKQALEDKRIKGITTVGAPLNSFYQEYSKTNVPLITRRTLSYVCNMGDEELEKYMKRLSLSAEQVQKLTLPITYIFSRRDEIIPSSEKQFIINNVSNLKFIEFNDIHGSPNHMNIIQKQIPLSVLKQSGSKNFTLRIILTLLLMVEKWKKRGGNK